ncbi:MAG: RNA polymerase sigma factor [Devosia sp.]|nr:RNA polymerase sigma factor [Devosia sp.]
MARLNYSLQTELTDASSAGRIATAIDPPFAIAGRPRDDDEELLLHISRDDQGAFRRLVERHIDRAYALALRMLGNPADADDVVQDSLLKVWTHRHRWEFGRAKFSTWLYRVITNRCIDLHRLPRMGDIDDAPEIPDQREDVITELHRANVTSLLEAAMARLPDQQRIALVLSYHENMSNHEIAEVMATTITAVESLLKRGRQHLRKLLDGAKDDITQSFTEA